VAAWACAALLGAGTTLAAQEIKPGQDGQAGQVVPPARPGPSRTDEALARLQVSLQQEPNLSAETKAAMAGFFDALAGRQAELDALDLAGLQRLAATPPATPGRWEKLKEQLTVYGDFRLRQEFNFDLDDQDDRDRTRFRLRLGGDYRLDDEWAVGARLRTGDPGDPNGPHSTLGDLFDSDSFELDRAFVAWKPAALQGLRLVGGKFAHPFYANPVFGELVWDADVNPEGLAAVYTLPGAATGDKLDFVLAHYFVQEQGGGDEATITLAQVAGTRRIAEHTTGTVALGFYDYGRLTPDGSLALVNDNPGQVNGGNQLIDTDGDLVADDFASDFEIWNPIAAVTYEGWGLPVTVSSEYIHNGGAAGSEDSGYALGASAGRQKSPGDWLWYGQYQKVEQDAVFAAFAQDDTLLTANQSGWVFGTRYRMTDAVGAHLWALVSSRDELGTTATTDSGGDQWRVRLDLDVRF
jgi:hypothetical protein